jgi:hypothetical protein
MGEGGAEKMQRNDSEEHDRHSVIQTTFEDADEETWIEDTSLVPEA